MTFITLQIVERNGGSADQHINSDRRVIMQCSYYKTSVAVGQQCRAVVVGPPSVIYWRNMLLVVTRGQSNLTETTLNPTQ